MNSIFSSGFVIFAIIVGFSFYAGIYFWIYWVLRLRLSGMAREKYHGRPVALFLWGILGFLAVVLMLYGLFIIISLLSGGGGLVAVIFAILIIAGLTGAIGWIVLGLKRRNSRQERRSFAAAHPLPKLQLWMQDLLAAAFCFAMYMTFQQSLGELLEYDSWTMAAFSSWVIFCLACGLYFALDVCRRSLRLQQPKPRFFFIMGMMLFTMLANLIPAWLTWRAWRYAMWKAGWVLGDDLIQKQRSEREAKAA